MRPRTTSRLSLVFFFFSFFPSFLRGEEHLSRHRVLVLLLHGISLCTCTCFSYTYGTAAAARHVLRVTRLGDCSLSNLAPDRSFDRWRLRWRMLGGLRSTLFTRYRCSLHGAHPTPRPRPHKPNQSEPNGPQHDNRKRTKVFETSNAAPVRLPRRCPTAPPW